MAKGQTHNNKMVKKPKKDTSPPKTVSPDAVRATVVTQVMPKGKLKNKPADAGRQAARRGRTSGQPPAWGHTGGHGHGIV